MSQQDDLWLTFADEPIAAIVNEIEAQDPELPALVDTPEKLLAFRTFSSIRVGIVLGRLLMDAGRTVGVVEGVRRHPAARRAIDAGVVDEEVAGYVGGEPPLRVGHRRDRNGRDPVASVDIGLRPKPPCPG